MTFRAQKPRKLKHVVTSGYVCDENDACSEHRNIYTHIYPESAF